MADIGKSFIRRMQKVISTGKEKKKIFEYKVVAPNTVDVKEIRHKLGMTQEDFSETFGFTVNSVRNWEQGRRTPEGPARILLTLIAANPEAVLETLKEAAES